MSEIPDHVEVQPRIPPGFDRVDPGLAIFQPKPKRLLVAQAAPQSQAQPDPEIRGAKAAGLDGDGIVQASTADGREYIGEDRDIRTGPNRH